MCLPIYSYKFSSFTNNISSSSIIGAATFIISSPYKNFLNFSTFGFKLKEGRFFSKDFTSDSTAIVLNEAAVRSLGLVDPIGKRVLRPTGENKEERDTVLTFRGKKEVISAHDEVRFKHSGNTTEVTITAKRGRVYRFSLK